MTKQLTSNVVVGGKWYGPDYPQNEVTSEVAEAITNEAAFAEKPVVEGYGDNRFRKDDFGVGDDEEAPSLRKQGDMGLGTSPRATPGSQPREQADESKAKASSAAKSSSGKG